MSRQSGSDPEIDRGRKILREMDRLERRKRRPRTLSCLPWIIALALLLGIAIVLLVGRERFALAWRHLTMPDSIPASGP